MSAKDNTPKTAREAQQQKEMRRSNAMYAVIAVLFVLLAVAVGVWKSNVIQKHATAANLYYSATAASADGSSSADAADKTQVASASTPQVNYYFTNIYQNFVNSNGTYLSYLGLNTAADLRSQTYPSDESKTWFDYFMDQTLDQMSTIYALDQAAAKEGYGWNDAMQAELDSTLDKMNSSAAAAGLSLDKYLQRIYGATMSRSVYETELKNVILANDYATDADGNAVEPDDAAKAAAMAEAKSAAEAMLADFQSGKSLSELADGNDKANYTDGKAASSSSSVLMTWLFDSARRSGDSAVLTDETGESCYVVSFGRRYRQEENTVNVRHILIQPASGTLSSDDDGYEEEQAQLKADAKAKAEELLAQWKAGDATEESFAQLAKENSSDGGSATNGGLYEQVYPGQMVASFNDWCFDPARQSGDTDIVETDYGYHIMYFVSTDLPYWQAKVESTLRNKDFSEWYANASAGYSAETADGAKYVG